MSPPRLLPICSAAPFSSRLHRTLSTNLHNSSAPTSSPQFRHCPPSPMFRTFLSPSCLRTSLAAALCSPAHRLCRRRSIPPSLPLVRRFRTFAASSMAERPSEGNTSNPSTHTNRLAAEHSPYLLQHAHNPVDWYPWGEEAFAEARRRDVPIFLSSILLL
ncbi:unnamed protein product [Linum tenue]|uniref:Spermatogenesis-associated protein 20-like TRX domain-containing protein n=1 Tax=Linum tenue TaxID=586396 RepID=A0AAV0MLI8_9ROSI|nr:unnamed protein product [Linum tenue]